MRGDSAIKITAYLLIMSVFAIVVLEVVYRFQIIDTYKPELRTYNSETVLVDNENTTILAMGDSFTAGNSSYPVALRKRLKGYRVINSGISGTGINEALIIAPRRFDDFNPSIFIYQIYVGNDLINIRYPVNWDTLSLQRNIYWNLIQYTRSLAYLNYRLAHNIGAEHDPKIQNNANEPGFSVEKYTKRDRLYLRADPAILEHQIAVNDAYKSEYAYFLEKLSALLANCRPASCRAYVIVVPHASQVHSRYLEHQKHLGAYFSNPDKIAETEYPFIRGVKESLAGNRNVTVLNPLSHLRHRENEGIDMYYQNDSHLKPAGQQALGDFLLDRIQLESTP